MSLPGGFGELLTRRPGSLLALFRYGMSGFPRLPGRSIGILAPFGC
jgi:hypothetical protein